MNNLTQNGTMHTMTNNKQQTAVEWYIEKLLDLDYEYAKGLITLGVWSERKKSLVEQAKEIEKEQIAKAFDRGRFWNMSWDGNSYYEEIIIKGNNE